MADTFPILQTEMDALPDGTDILWINGMPFWEKKDCPYMYDYAFEMQKATKEGVPLESVHRALILNDLWYVVYFVMQVPISNHPFWVQACKDVQRGPKSHTVDLWARDHGKSTIITTAETIQWMLGNPEKCCCIFSYKRDAALQFLRGVKQTFENSQFLRSCFPDIIPESFAQGKVDKEMFKWSEEGGLYLKRKSTSRREANLEAHGMVDSMPTGRHFERLIYDDVITPELAETEGAIQRGKDKFDFSLNCGAGNTIIRVIGTPYHHEDVLAYIQAKKHKDGTPIYVVRKKPATDDGTLKGKLVWLPMERWLELLAGDIQKVYSQQLLDPTPMSEMKLTPGFLRYIKPNQIPDGLIKLMALDPAGAKGRKDGRTGDSWAMGVIGVNPRIGFGQEMFDVYLLDLFAEPMDQAKAMKEIVNMYSRHGRIARFGVEKVGQSTAELHVQAALKARGKYLSEERGNFQVLSPAGRSKEFRILSNLQPSINNGKVIVSEGIPEVYRKKLIQEMEQFPFGHDDILDMLSYAVEMVRSINLTVDRGSKVNRVKRDRWGEESPKRQVTGWMYY